MEFQPTVAFKRHALLFRKFRSDELNSLNIAEPKGGLDTSDINKILYNCSHMTEIIGIHLEDTRLTMEGWKNVDKFPKLTHLWLSRVTLSPLQIATYKHFPRLMLLKLKTQLSVRPVLQKLRGSENMSNLSICETATTDEDAKLIGTFRNLKRLEIKNTKITDAGLLNLPVTIDALDLSGCNITSNCLPALRRMERLKKLKLDAYGWTALEMKALQTYADENRIELETSNQLKFD